MDSKDVALIQLQRAFADCFFAGEAHPHGYLACPRVAAARALYDSENVDPTVHALAVAAATLAKRIYDRQSIATEEVEEALRDVLMPGEGPGYSVGFTYTAPQIAATVARLTNTQEER